MSNASTAQYGTPPNQSQQLAHTGFDAWLVVVVGLVAIGGGILLRLKSRP